MSALKTAFDKSRVIEPLHTGGQVAISADGENILTCVGEEAVLTRLRDGRQLCRFIADNETIHSLCLTASASHLFIFTASLSLHSYDDPLSQVSGKSVRPSRTLSRAHDAPVHVCKADPTSSLLASGSADGVVKVWDIQRGFVTHVFKGHGGVVSALTFRYVHDASAVSASATLQLVTASVDTRLRVFDLSSPAARHAGGKASAILEGHVSVPRGLDVSHDGRWLISGGRDSVVIIWDFLGLAEKPPSAAAKRRSLNGVTLPCLWKTIPVLERVEAVGWLPGDTFPGVDALPFFIGGEKGVIRVWDARTGGIAFSFDADDVTLGSEGVEEQQEILDALYVPSTLAVMSVHADQNILFHSLSTRTLSRQLIGFNDEIIGAVFLTLDHPDSHVAVAANSSLIRIYSVDKNDARLLYGHTGMVLCLDRSVDGRFLASGSKDRSVRIWSYDGATHNTRCIAICEGHAESVGAIGLPRSRKPEGTDGTPELPAFLFSGSQDRTIKMWDLTGAHSSHEDAGHSPHRCKSLTTHKAHEKDINALDVSPNDRLLASCSQDKTAKVFEITYTKSASGGVRGDIRLLGVCKGHKRGVWSAKFGKAERVLATGSGDKTIKLWNLDDFSCVKTFEGHTNSVLQVLLWNNDLQMASAASDGLLKVWNVRSEECVATMDNHEEKIWALAISSDESTIITGGADSLITFWRDCTKEKALEEQHKRAETVLKAQDLANYLNLKDYRSAITLALAMDQPGRLLSIFKEAVSSASDDPGDLPHRGSRIEDHAINSAISHLSSTELVTLLRHVRDWNARANTSAIAQAILHSLFKLRSTDAIVSAFESNSSLATGDVSSIKRLPVNELVQSLIPYSERHLTRMDRLVQESYVLDFVLAEMDGGMFTDDESMD